MQNADPQNFAIEKLHENVDNLRINVTMRQQLNESLRREAPVLSVSTNNVLVEDVLPLRTLHTLKAGVYNRGLREPRRPCVGIAAR